MKTSTLLKLTCLIITVAALFSSTMFEVFGYALLIAITGCSGLICQTLEAKTVAAKPAATDYTKQNYDAKG
jgi:hypothetical protein